MSTYSRQTKHPETNEWHKAIWMDDYYVKIRQDMGRYVLEVYTDRLKNKDI